MSKKDEALKLALEALECDPLDMALNPDGHMGFRKDQAITAIREALAEQPVIQQGWDVDDLLDKPKQPAQQQEPVAYIHRQGNHWEVSERFLCDDEKARGWIEEPLYTSPPASKPWVGLTKEEIEELNCLNIMWDDGESAEIYNIEAFARAIEAKLREKNA